MLKIDDDSIARIEDLTAYLNHNFPVSSTPYLYLGWMSEGKKVLHTGKWKEKKFNGDELGYPIYADGKAGYLLSVSLVKYLAINFDQLELYANEDTAIGIWLNDSVFKNLITYVKDRKIQNDRARDYCPSKYNFIEGGKTVYLLGHQLESHQIAPCYLKLLDAKDIDNGPENRFHLNFEMCIYACSGVGF